MQLIAMQPGILPNWKPGAITLCWWYALGKWEGSTPDATVEVADPPKATPIGDIRRRDAFRAATQNHSQYLTEKDILERVATAACNAQNMDKNSIANTISNIIDEATLERGMNVDQFSELSAEPAFEFTPTATTLSFIGTAHTITDRLREYQLVRAFITMASELQVDYHVNVPTLFVMCLVGAVALTVNNGNRRTAAGQNALIEKLAARVQEETHALAARFQEATHALAANQTQRFKELEEHGEETRTALIQSNRLHNTRMVAENKSVMNSFYEAAAALISELKHGVDAARKMAPDDCLSGRVLMNPSKELMDF